MIQFLSGAPTSFVDPITAKVVTCSAVLSSNHQYTNDITEFPVDSGDFITDHVIKKPLVITIDAVISNTPLPKKGVVIPAPVFTKLPYSPGAISEIATLTDSVNRDANDAYTNLLLWREARTTLNLINGLNTFTNLQIKSWKVDLSKKTDTAFYFNITLQQIRIANSMTVDVQSFASSVRGKASPNKNIGTPATKQVPTSMLYTMVGGVTN